MKRALIAAAICFVLLVFLAGVVLFEKLRPMFQAMSAAQEVPQTLKLARVVAGANDFSKSTFFSAPELGVITDLQSGSDNGLVIVGKNGAVFLAEDHTLRKSITYDSCTSDVSLASIGKGAFLCRAAQMGGPSLIDLDGKTLWSYDRDSIGIGADDSAAGELGMAHTQGIAVGMNGNGGVRLLTPEGKEVWRKPEGNVWHIEIAATDDNSQSLILHSDAAGQLTVRAANGDIVSRTSPELYLAWFTLTPWGTNPNRNKLITAGEGGLYILSMDGKTVARLPTPENKISTVQAKGITVHFVPGSTSYASIIRNPIWNRTLLYIYDAENRITYDEILDHDCGSINAAKNANGSEDLLVGCDGTVIRYSPAARTP